MLERDRLRGVLEQLRTATREVEGAINGLEEASRARRAAASQSPMPPRFVPLQEGALTLEEAAQAVNGAWAMMRTWTSRGRFAAAALYSMALVIGRLMADAYGEEGWTLGDIAQGDAPIITLGTEDSM